MAERIRTMEVSREKKKIEAIARMKKWGIYGETIKQFEKDNLVSESRPPFGACFWLDAEQKKRVEQFEREHDALVYHVIHGFTNIGELENYLYVSDYEEEWEMDREAIENNQQLVYVLNHSMPDCSEFGLIGIELTPAAGLRRTW